MAYVSALPAMVICSQKGIRGMSIRCLGSIVRR